MDQALIDAELQVLVSRAQDGDTEAYSRIYDHYFPSVYRYTAFRVPSEVAEDLVADIFVQAWEKLHTYRARADVPFGAWLFRIARHRVIDAYRRYQAWEEVPIDMADPDDLNRADTSVRRAELLRVVRAALDALPRRYREVLHLSYFADLSHTEVARVLRLTEGAVRVLKFRALKKLEETLPSEFRGERSAACNAVAFSPLPDVHDVP